MSPLPHRRHALWSFANGFGVLGLAALLAEDGRGEPGRSPDDPLTIKPPHFPAKAKRVIFLFMSGGPSHVDLFDPKPKLKDYAGKPLPFEQPKLVRTRTVNCLPTPFKFAKHGAAGIDVSELFPHVARRTDDLCVLRGVVADNINHNGACLQMNTGEQAFSRPSLGSWLLYGLGTENRSLPGFVVISPSQPAQGAPLWSNSFLPAAFQGTLVSNLAKPIENIAPPDEAQRRELDALRKLNELHRRGREEDTLLSARIASYELAFRMQREAPEAFGIESESSKTKALYGVGEPATDIFAKQCLMARRLVERGVRMVQVYHTQTSKRSSCQLWDQHGGLRAELPANCAATDKPIAGLLTDLKARGLLKDTLVIWGGEFGRTPTAEGTDGREHHPFGFTMWLAGGGVKSGFSYGETDEFGWHAVKNKVHVHDLHATILHLMGLDHEKLTFRHAGRDYRLTDVSGRVLDEILA
jgi:hypothetical protein